MPHAEIAAPATLDDINRRAPQNFVPGHCVPMAASPMTCCLCLMACGLCSIACGLCSIACGLCSIACGLCLLNICPHRLACAMAYIS